MPLSLQAFEFAINCDGKELETHDVEEEGPNSMRAFVASEAGKQFEIVIRNKLSDFALSFYLNFDGVDIYGIALRARERHQITGIDVSATSVLPFKFQELELVDPDLEDAPVVPEMGTIELRAYRCHILSRGEYRHNDTRLHGGRASERSKQAGWHHISTADEIPADTPVVSATANMHDPRDAAPYASVKVIYRPRELLMAQGVIVGHGVDAGVSGGSEANGRKRAREGGSPGPSKKRTGPTVKKEELSADADARTQRIQALQAELNSLMAEQSSSSVKRELRTPSPIVVGQAAGKVIDLSLED